MGNSKIIEEAFNNIDPMSSKRIKILTDRIEYKSMSREEIDKHRIKATLDFDEEELVKSKVSYESAKYLNKKGDEVDCHILLERDNGEIIVQNLNGVRVCLTEDKLIK